MGVTMSHTSTITWFSKGHCFLTFRLMIGLFRPNLWLFELVFVIESCSKEPPRISGSRPFLKSVRKPFPMDLVSSGAFVFVLVASWMSLHTVRKKWKKAMFGEVDFLICHVVNWLLLGTFWGAEPEQETVPWFQQMASKVGLGRKQIFRHFPVQAAQSCSPLFHVVIYSLWRRVCGSWDSSPILSLGCLS